MIGRNIKRDRDKDSPTYGLGIDEEGYLFYFSRRPSRLCWWPYRSGRKHLRVAHMARRVELAERMERGEISLEDAQATVRKEEAT